MVQVVELLLQETMYKLQKQDITLSFDEPVVKKIANDGYDITLGARSLRRSIQNKIEDMLAKEILEGTVSRGARVKLSVSDTGNILLSS